MNAEKNTSTQHSIAWLPVNCLYCVFFLFSIRKGKETHWSVSPRPLPKRLVPGGLLRVSVYDILAVLKLSQVSRVLNVTTFN